MFCFTKYNECAWSCCFGISELLCLTLLKCAQVQQRSHDVLPTFVHAILASFTVTIKRIDFIYNLCFEQPQVKPEDHWSCKRSPDILATYKHNIYKTCKKQGQEMTLTFNTHLLSFTELGVCIYKCSGQTIMGRSPRCYIPSFVEIDLLVPLKKIF